MKGDAGISPQFATGDLDAHVREQLVDEYVQLTVERVDRVCSAWIELERRPDIAARADEVLHELDTMKGEAMLMGFADVSLVTHRMEELLLFAKKRKFQVPGTFGPLLLAGANTILSLIKQKTGTPQTVDLSTLLDVFDDLVEGEKSAPLQLEERTPQADGSIADALLASVQRAQSAHRRISELTGELAVLPSD